MEKCKYMILLMKDDKKDLRKKKAKEGANMEMIDNQSGIEVENRIERLENRNEDLTITTL